MCPAGWPSQGLTDPITFPDSESSRLWGAPRSTRRTLWEKSVSVFRPCRSEPTSQLRCSTVSLRPPTLEQGSPNSALQGLEQATLVIWATLSITGYLATSTSSTQKPLCCDNQNASRLCQTSRGWGGGACRNSAGRGAVLQGLGHTHSACSTLGCFLLKPWGRRQALPTLLRYSAVSEPPLCLGYCTCPILHV